MQMFIDLDKAKVEIDLKEVIKWERALAELLN